MGDHAFFSNESRTSGGEICNFPIRLSAATQT